MLSLKCITNIRLPRIQREITAAITDWHYYLIQSNKKATTEREPLPQLTTACNAYLLITSISAIFNK